MERDIAAGTSRSTVVSHGDFDFFGVAGKRRIRRVSVQRSTISAGGDFPAAFENWFREHGFDVHYVTVGGDAAFAVVLYPVGRESSPVVELEDAFSLDEVTVSEPLALVGACRPGIAGDEAAVVAVLRNLGEASIPSRFYFSGYTANSVVVADSEAE